MRMRRHVAEELCIFPMLFDSFLQEIRRVDAKKSKEKMQFNSPWISAILRWVRAELNHMTRIFWNGGYTIY